MNERIKELRKTLKLSQDEFGSRIGITCSALSNLESGKRKLSEQLVKSICHEFKVNYHWLTKGTGKMFLVSNTALADLIVEYSLDEVERKFIRGFLSLDKDKRKYIAKIINFDK